MTFNAHFLAALEERSKDYNRRPPVATAPAAPAAPISPPPPVWPSAPPLKPPRPVHPSRPLADLLALPNLDGISQLECDALDVHFRALAAERAIAAANPWRGRVRAGWVGSEADAAETLAKYGIKTAAPPSAATTAMVEEVLAAAKAAKTL